MDLELKDQHILVCGASSGFGRAIADRLLEEGATVAAVARRGELLEELRDEYPQSVTAITGDLTADETIDKIMQHVHQKPVQGAVINAGGPPAKGAQETTIEEWDEAYQLVMRWKVNLALRLVPLWKKEQYGRLLFVESHSIKQPIPNLVLSNAFRAGIAGFAKTLSQEIAKEHITVNILAPGAHNTPAIERVIQKRADDEGISNEEARQMMEQGIPVGRMGEGEELARLAAWILSPHAGYVTGQTFNHDGGANKSLFG